MRNRLAIVGFLVSVIPAIWAQWSLPELCWSFWVNGLFVSLLMVLVAVAKASLAPPDWLQKLLNDRVKLSLPILRLINIVAAVGLGLAVAQAYLWVFGFFGILLSAFFEMDPKDLFGRNGFINSDFITPIVFLLERFWPALLGTILTEFPDAFRGKAWALYFAPFSKQLPLTHIMVVLTPAAALLFWILFGEAGWQQPAIVAILALFHFFPRRLPPHLSPE